MIFRRKKRRIERVLVVEDEALVAFDTEHVLEDAGFDIVATIDSVAEALRIIAREPGIDLVLLDLNLSDGSGIDVARAAHAAEMHVLFVTGSCPGEAQALAAGCLAKPYPQRDLIAAIDAIEAVLDGVTPKKLPHGLSLFRKAA